MTEMMRKNTADESSALADQPRPQLSHSQLADVLSLTMRAGAMILRAGSASFRCEEVMVRMAENMGVERLDAYVTPTGIIASAYSGHEHRTQIRRIPSLAVDMNRIVELEKLSRTMPHMPDVQWMSEQMDAIEKMGAQYKRWQVALAVAIACGSFAIILGGGILEFIGAAIGAGIAQLVRMRMAHARFSPIPVTVVSAVVATAISYPLAELSIRLAPALGLTVSPRLGVIASVLLLVPGVPLVSAVLDLTRLDLLSGTARIMYATLIFTSIGLGMLAVLVWTGFSIL